MAPTGASLPSGSSSSGVPTAGGEEVELLGEAERPGLLHEGDLLRPPEAAEERLRPRLEQRGDVGAVVALAELRPVLLDHLDVGLEELQVGPELLPQVLAVFVVRGDVRPLLVREGRRLLGQHPRVLVHVVRGVGDVPVPVVPGQARGLAVGGEVEHLGVLGVGGDGQAHRARDAAGQEVHLLLEHQLAGGLDRLVGLELVVAVDVLDRPPEDAAGVVDLLGGHRQSLLVGEGEDGGDTAVRVDLADPDGLALGVGGCEDRPQAEGAAHEEGRDEGTPPRDSHGPSPCPPAGTASGRDSRGRRRER